MPKKRYELNSDAILANLLPKIAYLRKLGTEGNEQNCRRQYQCRREDFC